MQSRKKEDYICVTPFGFTEVFDKQQFLCCPGWLKEDIYETESIKDNFFSEKSNAIRDSIIDGSYKFCDSKECPHLQQLKQGKKIDRRFVPKTDKKIQELKNHTLDTVNFCFDRSCNLQCPSCRSELINYLGRDRDNVEEKLRQVNEEIAPTIKNLYLSGTADPFYSKSFRQWLINFDPSKFPNLLLIHIHTNGLLWTPQLWSKMKKIHPFVKTAEISIDAATKDTYENHTRIGGDWEKLKENLEFITSISTIKNLIFSFVTQDSNFREMNDFIRFIKSYKSLKNKNYNIFFSHIINWGTYSEEQYLKKDVSNPSNLNFNEFVKMVKIVNGQKNVTHNFTHLLENSKSLI